MEHFKNSQRWSPCKYLLASLTSSDILVSWFDLGAALAPTKMHNYVDTKQ